MAKAHIRKEDSVVVIAGKDRDLSRPRRVLQVYASKSKILVEGVNMVKRHERPNPQKNIKGGILEKESAIHISNVMLVDPETKRPTRVGRKKLDDGSIVRISRRSGAVLDK